MLLAGGWFWLTQKNYPVQPTTFENVSITVPETKESIEEKSGEIAPIPSKQITETFQYTIPFTSQAPTGDWSKSIFQDGCEETSVLMLWMARNGKALTPDEVKVKLTDMATFQTKKIGHAVDTDAIDTNEYLLKQYFHITDARVERDVTLDMLKQALLEGVVIVPTNGRALKNPNFTAPGPLEHMLVIKGYDTKTKEFITNDPGTRKGEGYRYPEQILYDAIREYPTGKHLPIQTEQKVMIVIPFEQ